MVIKTFLNIRISWKKQPIWITLGQPLAVMMYYHDFVVEHFGRDLITAYGEINSFNTSQPIII